MNTVLKALVGGENGSVVVLAEMRPSSHKRTPVPATRPAGIKKDLLWRGHSCPRLARPVMNTVLKVLVGGENGSVVVLAEMRPSSHKRTRAVPATRPAGIKKDLVWRGHSCPRFASSDKYRAEGTCWR